jgi:hypothetical protein
MSPDLSPESPHGPPPPRPDGAFTAVLIPLGAVAAVILLFALCTTDRLTIAGLTHKRTDGAVTLFDVRIGSTDFAHPGVWGVGFLAVFLALGGTVGWAIGKGLDRLCRWGT